jgi:hypothetical protein
VLLELPPPQLMRIADNRTAKTQLFIRPPFFVAQTFCRTVPIRVEPALRSVNSGKTHSGKARLGGEAILSSHFGVAKPLPRSTIPPVFMIGENAHSQAVDMRVIMPPSSELRLRASAALNVQVFVRAN